jgi:Fe-S-cluster containining protein
VPDWSQPPAVSRLFQHADQWFRKGRAAVQEQLPCRQGCSHCCHGTFAVTVLDHIHIQRGMTLLPSATREEIAMRARTQASSMKTAFSRLTRSIYVDDWTDDELDHLVTRFSHLPCPALDEQGSCLIYTHRPMTCRMMGLPIEREGLVEGACDVQTSVPLIRIPDIVRREETELAKEEAELIAEWQTSTDQIGEELLLPYGFIDEPVA